MANAATVRKMQGGGMRGLLAEQTLVLRPVQPLTGLYPQVCAAAHKMPDSG